MAKMTTITIGRKGQRVAVEATTNHKEVIGKPEDARVVLVDVSKCMACRGCQVSCKRWNELPAEKTFFHGTYQNPADLSPITYTLVKFNEVAEGGPEPQWLFRKHQCMHCSEPVCVEVCPIKAIYKTKLGAVVIDEDKCKGYGNCIKKCPWKAPKADHQTGKAHKCVFCLDRVVEGLPPACVKACPTGALVFGTRPQMYELAQKRQKELMAQHEEASVYGTNPKESYGGLHYIYVLAEEGKLYDLEAKNSLRPTTDYAWNKFLRPMSGFGLGMGIMAGFLKMVETRREKVQSEKKG